MTMSVRVGAALLAKSTYAPGRFIDRDSVHKAHSVNDKIHQATMVLVAKTALPVKRVISEPMVAVLSPTRSRPVYLDLEPSIRGKKAQVAYEKADVASESTRELGQLAGIDVFV